MQSPYRKIAMVLLMVAGVAPAFGQSTHSQTVQGTLANGPQMQPYRSTAGRFSVSFPQGEVKQSTDSIPYTDGSKGTMYEFSVEAAGGSNAYMVMYNDYAAGQAAGDPQTVLAKTRDGAVKGKTLLSDKVISLNGVPGREFTAKDDNWNYTVRQYLQGKRLFQLIIVSNAANPATQTSAFLNSFKIL
jgi:hypothetical protein